MKRPAAAAAAAAAVAKKAKPSEEGALGSADVSRAQNSSMLSFLHKGTKANDPGHAQSCKDALESYGKLSVDEKKQAIADFFNAGGAKGRGLSKLLSVVKCSEASSSSEQLEQWVMYTAILEHHKVPA